MAAGDYFSGKHQRFWSRSHHKPISNNTILKGLERLGYKGRMTGHGFRGLASTILHEQGFPHDHIELQLAHAPRNAVSAAYNHALYLELRTKNDPGMGRLPREDAAGREGVAVSLRRGLRAKIEPGGPKSASPECANATLDRLPVNPGNRDAPLVEGARRRLGAGVARPRQPHAAVRQEWRSLFLVSKCYQRGRRWGRKQPVYQPLHPGVKTGNRITTHPNFPAHEFKAPASVHALRFCGIGKRTRPPNLPDRPPSLWNQIFGGQGTIYARRELNT